ncbi:hypothetical protein D3C72_1454350 [compost metagenome]
MCCAVLRYLLLGDLGGRHLGSDRRIVRARVIHPRSHVQRFRAREDQVGLESGQRLWQRADDALQLSLPGLLIVERLHQLRASQVVPGLRLVHVGDGGLAHVVATLGKDTLLFDRLQLRLDNRHAVPRGQQVEVRL